MALLSDPSLPAGSFHLRFTPLGARIAAVSCVVWSLLFVLAVLPPSWLPFLRPDLGSGDLLNRQPIWEILALQPPLGGPPGGAGFHWHQLLTAPLFFPPGQLGALVLSVFGLGFFGAGVEQFLGRRRFLVLVCVALVGSVVGGVLFGPIQHPQTLHAGFGGAVLALVVVHCSLTPHAFVTFLFVIPVRMRWVAAGTAFLVVGRTLGMFEPFGGAAAVGGWELGGMVSGWAWWRYGGRIWGSRPRHRAKGDAFLRTVSRQVEGGGDGPVYH